jgi:hypothetical protein
VDEDKPASGVVDTNGLDSAAVRFYFSRTGIATQPEVRGWSLRICQCANGKEEAMRKLIILSVMGSLCVCSLAAAREPSRLERGKYLVTVIPPIKNQVPVPIPPTAEK